MISRFLLCTLIAYVMCDITELKSENTKGQLLSAGMSTTKNEERRQSKQMVFYKTPNFTNQRGYYNWNTNNNKYVENRHRLGNSWNQLNAYTSGSATVDTRRQAVFPMQNKFRYGANYDRRPVQNFNNQATSIQNVVVTNRRPASRRPIAQTTRTTTTLKPTTKKKFKPSFIMV